MATVDNRKVLMALRQRYLTQSPLPTTTYDGVTAAPSAAAVCVFERFHPDIEEQIAFGVTEGTGSIVYEVYAPAANKPLIEAAWVLAQTIKGLYEHGSNLLGQDNTAATIIKSYITQNGTRTGSGSEFYVIPVVIRWRSFAALN